MSDSHEQLRPEIVLGRPSAGEIGVHEARERNHGKTDGHEQTCVEASVKKKGTKKRQEELWKCCPKDCGANLSSVKTAHRKRLRNNQDSGKKNEAKGEHPNRQQIRVPFAEVRQIHQRIRTAQATHKTADQQECSTDKQRCEQPGAPPVESLSLIECGEDQGETSTGVEKPDEARCSARCSWLRRLRYSEINACHHHGRDECRGPKHPLPGEMLPVETIERRRKIDGFFDASSIECYRERKIAEGDVAQGKGQGQGIEGAGSQACDDQQENQQAVAVD